MATQNNLTTDIQTRIQFSELDFDKIKVNLKEYLKTKPQFLDYNFEGSVISLLLDLLAYNTQYQAFYLNFVATELFLESSEKRSNVVSHSKALGYNPSSVTAARVLIDEFVVQANDPQEVQIIIPRGTEFVSNGPEESFTFVVLEDYETTTFVDQGANRNFIFNDIEAFEGTIVRQVFTISDENVRNLVLRNINIDTSKIRVTVFDTEQSPIGIEYFPVTNITNINSTSTAYYIEETDDLQYRIYFGDGILSKQVINGNYVVVEYLVTSGPNANNISTFELGSDIAGVAAPVSITNENPSGNGGDIESVASIKLNAPLFYSSQNRAVTAKDYVAITRKIFSNVRSINAWGGEDNDPPILGYVFISILPQTGDFLNDGEKIFIEETLRSDYSVLTVQPIVVDADYLYIKPRITANVLRTSSANNSLIRQQIVSAALNYQRTDLNTFTSYFRFSKFTTIIDNTSDFITNNNTTIKVEKRLSLDPTTNNTYSIKFRNKIEPESIRSNYFRYLEADGYDQYLADDGEGNISVFEDTNISLGDLVEANVGTVNYNLGEIILNDFAVFDLNDETRDLRVEAIPRINDVKPQRNMILRIDPLDIDVILSIDEDRFGS